MCPEEQYKIIILFYRLTCVSSYVFIDVFIKAIRFDTIKIQESN